MILLFTKSCQVILSRLFCHCTLQSFLIIVDVLVPLENSSKTIVIARARLGGLNFNGFQTVRIVESNEIFSSWSKRDQIIVTQSHKDYLTNLPNGFVRLAESEFCKIEAIKHKKRPIYGVQAHIERTSEENSDGLQILRNFILNASIKEFA
jgi:gamma-glutamyl-gamma-aminobutyrate hydrolase PuuD